MSEEFTPEFMAQQRELAEQVDELRKLDEDAVQSYLDCGGLIKVYPRFSLHNARIINTFKSNAANNFIPALDEIEQLRADRDSESRWAKEYLARAERAEAEIRQWQDRATAAARLNLENGKKLIKAEADAQRLADVLGKFRIVISGYARVSESHLPEVDAALAAHDAAKDGPP
jgi:hypothetical protein